VFSGTSKGASRRFSGFALGMLSEVEWCFGNALRVLAESGTIPNRNALDVLGALGLPWKALEGFQGCSGMLMVA
jgi:hypothetical protein